MPIILCTRCVTFAKSAARITGVTTTVPKDLTVLDPRERIGGALERIGPASIRTWARACCTMQSSITISSRRWQFEPLMFSNQRQALWTGRPASQRRAECRAHQAQQICPGAATRTHRSWRRSCCCAARARRCHAIDQFGRANRNAASWRSTIGKAAASPIKVAARFGLMTKTAASPSQSRSKRTIGASP